MQIYTIGHSNHQPSKFLDLLSNSKIQVLVDVRSNPNSQWATFANRDNFEEILASARIEYTYLGDALGGRPLGSDNYYSETGKADYAAIQQKQFFKQGISKLVYALENHRLCIMCAEENPTSCHRNLLVAESLRKIGVQVFHIRGDGRVQTDEELWKENAGVPAAQYNLPF